MLQYDISNNLPGVFPNVSIAFRIYLRIWVSCVGERPFSTLKRVKKLLNINIETREMSIPALLCIESGMMKKVDTDEIIKNYASGKCRTKM